MKFLCPSCKAKYQIADEKVIGRTVKMKCRQCGRLIEINEAVIGEAGLPSVTPPKAEAHGADPSSLEASKPAPSRVEASKPEHGGIREGAGTASNLHLAGSSAKGTPPPKPVRALTPPAGTAAATKKPTIPTAPARTFSNAALQTAKVVPPPADKPRISTVSVPRPDSPKQTTAGRFAGGPAALGDPARSIEAKAADIVARDSAPPASQRESNVGASPGGLKRSSSEAVIGRLPGVSETVASSLGASPTSKDPLAGAFTKAVAAPAVAEPSEHPLAGDEWYVGVNDQPIGPIRLAEIRDRAAKGEITPECLVWRDGFEDWKPLTAFPELVAVVDEGIASYRSLRPPAPSGVAAAPRPEISEIEPSRVSATASTPSAVSSDDEPIVVAGLSKPKIPIAAWLAIFMALALGVTIGLVLIKPEPPKQIIKYVEVPVAPKPAANGEQASGQAANPEGNVETGTATPSPSDKRNGSAARKVATNGTSEVPVAAPSAEPSQGLKGLQGLQGLGGPRTGPASDVGASAAAHQQLDSTTLSRTVSRYTASVKRSCWQPALDTRAPDASTSAKISANIVVAPSGKVQSVTVSPDPKGYRGLSSCIQARIRNWEFPPAGGSTEFNVPFVFAAQ